VKEGEDFKRIYCPWIGVPRRSRSGQDDHLFVE